LQEPVSAYDITGSTITFTAAPATGADFFGVMLGAGVDIGTPGDDTVTLAKMAAGTDGNLISYDASGNPVAVATGTVGQVLTSAGAGAPPAFEDAGGATVLDVVGIWRPTGNTTISANPTYLTGTWEADDSVGAAQIGSAMTVSSGVFTFPSIGIWLVEFKGDLLSPSGTDLLGSYEIHVATDAGAGDTYATRARAFFEMTSTSSRPAVGLCAFIFDVTSVTTHKVKFAALNQGTADWTSLGSTIQNATWAKFTRLGNT
jgi:hypothetical protein